MKKFSSGLARITVAAAAGSLLFAAGEKRIGTAAASQLLIPVGAREIAMGGSSAAVTSGIEALFWNPAGISRSGHNADAMFSRMDYFGGIGVNFLAVSGNFPTVGTLAFSIKSLDFGEIPLTTMEATDGTGGTFSPTFFTAGLTFAKGLTDRVYIGSTVSMVSESFERVGATGVALSVGVQYSDFVNVPGLNLGIVIKDVGTQMAYDGPGLLRRGKLEGTDRGPAHVKVDAASFDLPSTMELGMAYRIPLAGMGQVTLAGAFQNNNYADDEIRLGGELAVSDMVFLRAGSSRGAAGGKGFLFDLSAGGGVRLNVGGIDLEVDYGYRSAEVFSNNHVFGVKLGF